MYKIIVLHLICFQTCVFLSFVLQYTAFYIYKQHINDKIETFFFVTLCIKIWVFFSFNKNNLFHKCCLNRNSNKIN